MAHTGRIPDTGHNKSRLLSSFVIHVMPSAFKAPFLSWIVLGGIAFRRESWDRDGSQRFLGSTVENARLVAAISHRTRGSGPQPGCRLSPHGSHVSLHMGGRFLFKGTCFPSLLVLPSKRLRPRESQAICLEAVPGFELLTLGRCCSQQPPLGC